MRCSIEEGYMSILPTDGPGLSPNEPMAIVQRPIVQVESSSIPDGRYFIKNRAAGFYWNARYNPITTVHFYNSKTPQASGSPLQVNEHFPIIPVFKG
jgi:hypothetical protein